MDYHKKNNTKLTLTQPEMLATRIWANPGLITTE